MERAFLITWVTHNSRVSERMTEFKVEAGEPILLSLEEEIEITAYIYEVVLEDCLKVISYNICMDHVHIILICKEEELNPIVQKLKAVSARKFNISHGSSFSSSGNKGACSLVQEFGRKRGKAQYHLWAQKYNCSYLDDEEKYHNAIWYVKNNRKKHGLPFSKKLEEIIAKIESSVNDDLRGL